MKVKLKILMPDGATDVKEFVADSVSIGRDPECDLVVDDGEERRVSWLHVRLETDDNAIVIRDFHSKNGTFLNNERVDGAAPLRVGDVVRLGQSGPKLLVLEADPFGFTAAAAGIDGGASEGAGCSENEDDSILGQPVVRYAAGAAIVVLLFLVSLVWITGGGEPRAGRRVRVGAREKGVSSENGSSRPETSKPRQVVKAGAKDRSMEPTDRTDNQGATTAEDNADNGEEDMRGLSPEQIEDKYHKGIVWLGAELRGYKWPLCTAWAVRPNRLVTTAREASQLKEYHANGERVFAFLESANDQFVAVEGFQLPEGYDKEEPFGGLGWDRNVAIITLAAPLDVTCEVVSLVRSENIADMRLVSLGYSIPYDPLKPYDTLNPPKLVRSTGKVDGTRPIRDAADDLPLIETDLEELDGLAGAPVFDPRGKVIGFRISTEERWYLIPADRILDLLSR